ncbi:hypothetical protein [Desulfotignum phosphitoxidans]|uniref:Uncharacterized protein n=1 Tax=Desulfotignum phosphitoxidans DSM 13687 TaxID=1286635 RepID=S0FSQ6_9BACT|nr:hypothetical protein [Desulfotignum phosphitoxidans]EMS78123.1 hypothetical protein Dpo_10c01170 [Desulfotignum phosphitoxidans DSM 13687]
MLRPAVHKASVSIEGLEQPFSFVQVTVYYQNQEGLSSQQTFPVHVMFLKKAELTSEKEGFQVKQIPFECTRGKVQIDARPDGFSGSWK